VVERDRWAHLLSEAADERATQPQRICELCVSMLGVTGAGISMVTSRGNRGVVCSTDDISAQIEDLQLTLGEGPCQDAARAGAPVLVPDLAEPGDVLVRRWPTFMQGVHAAGVRAVFAFPMRIGAINVGVLDLYRSSPGELNSLELPAALMAADAAALALLHLDTEGDSAFTSDHDDRSSIQMQVHQATGMVTVQLGVTVDEAFLMLRARAFAAGRPLADIARDVVERRVRFSTED
jgi:GAF domain-containing protein